MFIVNAYSCRLLIQQQEVAAYKEKAEKQTKLITDYELEIQLLRKQLENLETERQKDHETISRLEELLRQAREVRSSRCYIVIKQSIMR